MAQRKHFLLRKIRLTMLKIYGVILNDNKKFVSIIFLYFFAEKGLGTFLVTLYETK